LPGSPGPEACPFFSSAILSTAALRSWRVVSWAPSIPSAAVFCCSVMTPASIMCFRSGSRRAAAFSWAARWTLTSSRARFVVRLETSTKAATFVRRDGETGTVAAKGYSSVSMGTAAGLPRGRSVSGCGYFLAARLREISSVM
jgi:hypothetical protein